MLGSGIVRVVLACLLVLGCKDKPKNQVATPAPPAPKVGSAAARPEPELRLPKPSGTPPVKTTKAIAPERLAALAKLDYPGFSKDVRRQDDRGLDIRYKTEARPRLAVTLSVHPCFKCEAMVLEKWQKVKDGMRGLLAPELRDLPDTKFELGATALAGAPVIYTYQVAYLNGPDPSGAQSSAYSDAYALYYNDGANMIRVVAEYKDDQPASRDDMLRLAPREDLERIALAFLDAYTHAW
jgi:hypothetical protein